MPRKRTTRRTHPPPSPLEQFFSGLKDTVLDFVEDAAYDLQEAMYRQQAPPPPPPKNATPKANKRPRTRQSTVAVHTHYSILGVTQDAPIEVIQAAFRALSRRYHPDVPKTGDAERMKRLNASYEVLSDAKLRKEYDRSLRT